LLNEDLGYYGYLI